MMQLFNEFMHIYFWVYLVMLLLGGIALTNEDYRENLQAKGAGFFGIAGFTLWLMSWHY
jgi:hypothetical protein